MKKIKIIGFLLIFILVEGSCRRSIIEPNFYSLKYYVENQTSQKDSLIWYRSGLLIGSYNVNIGSKILIYQESTVGLEIPTRIAPPFYIHIDDTIYNYDSVRIIIGNESRLSVVSECNDPNNILCVNNYVLSGTSNDIIYTFTIR